MRAEARSLPVTIEVRRLPGAGDVVPLPLIDSAAGTSGTGAAGECNLVCVIVDNPLISPEKRTLQGRPLITMKPFFLIVPACWGYVRDAPDSVDSKVS